MVAEARVRAATPREREALGLSGGSGLIVVEVGEGSLAAQSGLEPGDVILEANGRVMDSVDAFRNVLEGDAKAKGVVMLLVNRQGRAMFRTIPLS